MLHLPCFVLRNPFIRDSTHRQNDSITVGCAVSQSVSYFTVPPRSHPSTGSQSGSTAPVLTQVPSTLLLYSLPGATQYLN